MKIALVGATGAVGTTLLRILEERRIKPASFGAFASREHAAPVRFAGRNWPVLAASKEALRDYDVVFFAGGEDASADLASACAENGAIVIDNSATFRMQPGVPLVVPEINGDRIDPDNLIYPVANCTAIVLTMALAPIARTAGLQSVRVATYQAVSGAGRAGLDELEAGERAIAAGEPEPPARTFTAPIARNVVPQVGSFDELGESGEERKVAEETRKILGLRELHVFATTVRVPVQTAHSVAVFIETARDTNVPELGAALEQAPGVVYHPTGIVTPRDVEGTDQVHVARLRAENGSPRYFALWAVGDQLRKGAATNGVQILELLIERGLAGRRRVSA